MTSSMFELYKVLGLITGPNPPIFRDGYIYTVIGNSFNCFNTKLKLGSSGPQLEKDITCIEVLNGRVYAAVGPDIIVMNRKLILKTLTGHNKNITHLYTYGGILISFDQANKCHTWNDDILTNSFEFGGNLRAIVHPKTYLDKIVIGTQEGHVAIYNFRAGALVHRFSYDHPVSCIENSPCLDIIAIGLTNGDILVQNIKSGKVLMKFHQSPGPIQSISFRTDEPNVMASCTATGEVAFWNLSDQKLIHVLQTGQRAVTWIYFMHQEPLLYTSGDDNSLKQYIFDRIDKPRMLRQLIGNDETPHILRFYDPSGNFLLSVDSQIKTTNLNNQITSTVSKSNHKFPKIVDLDFCYLRQDDWDNMITAHDNRLANLWNVKNQTINTKKVVGDPWNSVKTKGDIRVVKVSVCGNYAVIGKSSGVIEKWNMQSATQKLQYIDDQFAHIASISGLALNGVNSILTSVSLDGFLKFWSFEDGHMIKKIDIGSSINKLVSNNNMVALVTDDEFSILLYDILTMRLMRKFTNPEVDKYNDIVFSHDSKFILAVNDQSSLFVWDIITGNLVNWIKVKTPIVSMSFHPDGSFIATTHRTSVGIHLWVNKILFGKTTLSKVTKPTFWYDIGKEMVEDPEQFNLHKTDNSFLDEEKLIRMTGLSKTQFYTITHLEEIREKSKVESTKTKIIAPFFLTKAPIVVQVDEEEVKPKTNEFSQKKLVELIEKSERHVVLEYIRELSPKQIDLNIRTLSPLHDMKEMQLFLEFATREVESLENFDLIQAMITVFLQIHGEIIITSESPALFEKIELLKQKQKVAFEKLNDLVISNASLSKILTGSN